MEFLKWPQDNLRSLSTTLFVQFFLFFSKYIFQRNNKYIQCSVHLFVPLREVHMYLKSGESTLHICIRAHTLQMACNELLTV